MKSAVFFALGACCALAFGYLVVIRPLRDSLSLAAKAAVGRNVVEAWWLDGIAKKIDEGDLAGARNEITKRRSTLTVPNETDDVR